ncbi:MAG: ABC transporter ATP-binding protein [Candidatus Latescibacteria bacterium]|nr:ABC transporter ATP-binding protein [Candidatus Latescibacterota bacterium]MBT4139875.1 ABC transporter ATP-binding protein [Candidatus Latescibacterota bacterium]MBT5828795.1 ABC transporter ATP-binding protein [Candidatus Latescibacterota bacterium]
MAFNPVRPFWPYLKPYKKHVFVGLLLLLGAQAVTAAIPMLLKWAIDTAKIGLEKGDRFNGITDTLTGTLSGDLAFYGSVMAGLAVIQWVMSFGMRWYIVAMSRLVERDIRTLYVRHLVRLPMAFFQGQRVGDLMARALNDVEAIQRFLYHAFRMVMQASITFILSLVLMCMIDWELAIYSLAPMPVMVLAARWVGRKMRQGYRRVQEQFAVMTSKIQENLSGIRVVKAYARGEREMGEFSDMNDEYVLRNRHLVNIRSLFYPFTFLLNGVSMLVILWLGGLRVIDGALTLGAFVAFNTYLIRLSRPMMMLGRIVDEQQRAEASMARIQAVLNYEPQNYGQYDPAADGVNGEIEFRDVSFTYDAEPVLKHINLKIPAGSKVAFVGRVGAGKSTLARLIPRLMDVTEGDILIDGESIREMPLAKIRSAIGYVPQETFLFSDTIRENVAVGTFDIEDGAVEEATEVSQLAPDLDVLPRRLETIVGERGVTLSGGQKQRTAIARAVIREPKILILDDALSSVDTNTEEEILRRLKGVMASRTTLVIAHRVSSVKDADHIVVMDEGEIVEQGSHDELVELGGIYADMYQRQHLAEELDEM